MLNREQRRDVLGTFLVALALILLLALFPVELLGERGARWFPAGNAMGRFGGWVRSLLLPAFGMGSPLLPLAVGTGGAVLSGWVAPSRGIRRVLLALSFLLLLPPVAELVRPGEGRGGALGSWVARLLEGGFGVFGGVVIGLVLLLLATVATLGWNPLVPLGRFGFRIGGVAARGVATAGGVAARKGGEAVRTAVARRARTTPGDAGAGAPEPEAPGLRTAEIPEEEIPAMPAPPAGRGGASSRRTEVHPGSAHSDGFPADPLSPGERSEAVLPPLHLLTEAVATDRAGMERDLDRLGEVLVEKLATFQVESTLGGRTTGPVVTQFEVIPAPGVKVNRIANLDADLALAMKARSIRIVAPIPGKGAVGVEIPNPRPDVVMLREILEAREFQSSRGELPLALGRDLTGGAYVADLAKMPHALIAGATGAGKSVCLNTVITSLVYRHTPETLRLLMIDPKMVELSIYADLPHLRHPVVTDPKEAAGILKWAVLEMERRYALLSTNGVRSLREFNQRVRDGQVLRRSEVDGPDGPEGDPERWIHRDGVLPFIVLVVDELADLMMSVQAEVERPLTLLAQKARAIGIHIILATQRPSVNVITGLIKANFPCRIAFRVASKTDSRTILDQNGADALLGNGDMLFLPPGQPEPVRVQGAFIPTEDTERLTAWFRAQRRLLLERGGIRPQGDEPDILEIVRAWEAKEGGEGDPEAIQGDWDDLFREAAEVCIQHQQGSTSLLQRRLRIGYGRAARIVDQLESAGVLGAADGSKPREVLVSLAELDAMLGRDAGAAGRGSEGGRSADPASRGGGSGPRGATPDEEEG